MSSAIVDTPVTTQKPNGFALIDLIFVCGMIGLISSIAVPRMLLARQSASAASAIGSLRTINSAELSFAVTCGSGFYAPKLTTLGVAPPGSPEAFISPDIGSADSVTKSGYVFQLAAEPFDGAPPTCNGLAVGATGRGYRAAAEPLEPTNPRFFATNANSTIWEDTTSMFAVIGEYSDPASGRPIH
jgi:type II secretory pathway pseudopilin PulG